jgi:hypothetical protein
MPQPFSLLCLMFGITALLPVHGQQKIEGTPRVKAENGLASDSYKALRQWSIIQADIGDHMAMTEKPRDVTDCRSGPAGWEKVFWLSRPGAANCTAIVVTLNKPILNPYAEFNYGPIPDLPDITKEQAQALWGTVGAKTLPDKNTYKLVSKDRNDFFLDVIFEHGLLKEYRVRSTELSSSPWTSTLIKRPTLPPMEGS